MLRQMLIALGFLVVTIPYLGFPQAWDTVLLTVIGFLIMLLVFVSRGPSPRRDDTPSVSEERPVLSREGAPRALHVEHTEVEERPDVRIERETVVDTARVAESSDTETTIEQKMTMTRRRRKKSSDNLGEYPDTQQSQQ